MRIVARLAEAFERSSKPEQALNEFLCVGLEAARADAGVLYLRREDKIICYAARGLAGETIKALSTLDLDTKEFLASEGPIICDTVQQPWAVFEGEVHTVVVCPLVFRGELLGAAVCGYRRKISRHRLYRYAKSIAFLTRVLAFAVENFLLLERLEKQEEQLRRIAADLVKVQEKERARLARELHDQVGQALAAVKFNLEVLRHGRGDKEWQEEAVQACLQLVGDSMRELKRIIAGLRPVILEERGVVEAIQWYLDSLSRTTGIAVSFTFDGLPPKLPDQVQVSLFRTVQEALANVLKHSGATEVRVELRRDGSFIVLRISDNGCGFPLGTATGTPVVPREMAGGIVGIRERAVLLGGKFDLFSIPGKGTTVQVRIPLSAD